MRYLYNGRGLYYELQAYSKKKNLMVLVDPHTSEIFELKNARETIKFAGYKVVKSV